MDKETMQNICEIIKVSTPLLILILSVCGFTHVNTQVNEMNYDMDNMHDDVHNLEDLHLQNMTDEQIDDYKDSLDDDKLKDLENRSRFYLND